MNTRFKKTPGMLRTSPLLMDRKAAIDGNLNEFAPARPSIRKGKASPGAGANRAVLNPDDLRSNAEGGAAVAAIAAPAGQPATPADFQEGIDHVEAVDFSAAKSVSDPQLIDFSGDFIWFQSSTNSTDKLRVRIGRQSNPFLTLLPGQSIGGRRFKKIWLAWALVAPATAGVLIVSNNHGQNVMVTG